MTKKEKGLRKKKYIRKNAASDVDRVSAKEYEQNLDENIHQLVEDLKRKR